MKSKSIYSQVPKAKRKAIADKNPMGTVTVGPPTPKMVPQGPSDIHGLNVPAHSFKTPSIKGAQRYGNVAKLKSSGNPKAHRVGSR